MKPEPVALKPQRGSDPRTRELHSTVSPGAMWASGIMRPLKLVRADVMGYGKTAEAIDAVVARVQDLCEAREKKTQAYVAEQVAWKAKRDANTPSGLSDEERRTWVSKVFCRKHPKPKRCALPVVAFMLPTHALAREVAQKLRERSLHVQLLFGAGQRTDAGSGAGGLGTPERAHDRAVKRAGAETG